VSPAENDIVNAELNQQQKARDSVLIVSNILKYVVNDFVDDFLVRHDRSICCHTPNIHPENGY
jgi:hypothetical protein